MIPRLALPLVLAFLGSCASLPFGGSRFEIESPDEVPAAIAAARRDLEAGKTEKALQRVRAELDPVGDGRLSGPFRVDVFDPEGNIVFSGTGTATARPFEVQPL